MKHIKIECSRQVTFDYDEVAYAIAELNSNDFGEFIQKLVDHLKQHCVNPARYEAQLCWIGSQLTEEGRDFFERVSLFAKDEELRK